MRLQDRRSRSPGAGSPFKETLNNARKYVASSSPSIRLDWPNSTLLHGDIPAAVADLPIVLPAPPSSGHPVPLSVNYPEHLTPPPPPICSATSSALGMASGLNAIHSANVSAVSSSWKEFWRASSPRERRAVRTAVRAQETGCEPGGPVSTVGTYSSSWSLPSNVRLATISRVTSGYPS